VVRIVVGSGPAVAHAGQLKGSSETEGAHDLGSVPRPASRGRHTAIFGRRAVAADGPLPKVGIDFLLESVDFSSRFRVEFPISGTTRNLCRGSQSTRKLNFANFFPLEKPALSPFEKLVGH
jgi:hypothetical protein